MGILTPELSLYLPGGGSLGIGGSDEVADIDQLNQNFQKIDIWAGDIEDDITAVENAMARSQLQGTTAQRDTRYGVPSNDTQRAALANQVPIWFNTELGWEEGYFAPTGLSGLTARGLVSGSAAGWYPIGEGPALSLAVSAQQTVGVGGTFTNWTDPGTNASWRKGGTDFFTLASGVITLVKAGRYAVAARFAVQNGTGTHVVGLRLNGVAGTVIRAFTNTLHATEWTYQNIDVSERAFVAGDNIRVVGSSGSVIIGMDGDGTLTYPGEFVVRYLGPSLVSQ